MDFRDKYAKKCDFCKKKTTNKQQQQQQQQTNIILDLLLPGTAFLEDVLLVEPIEIEKSLF